ncbi:putative secondary metabolism biosynthetic enzyme [Pyricularia oryzae]|uniref:Secondary metabolism biosynthetic enzyme n=1 Tax=Pyricularia grisea TaxID=148305 RepID=A0ABQ8N509_PYRGI|nr:putative secondary metabolism biosynthetic enzyme [Pyricularia oryzae]KAI6291384.1 putative secondary metabolism biosynthetic enzyme [Pyricularia grisea]KAI6252606.1 putative secondary metabolism biosynthetic enzyme [Pyricularia oryzae]KAI6266760.1 putative secondary metabolism biosynthetic enzyme [Pyricularia oryzae]KAI6276559.1 putative secondary metabolism biosynthetic enzyme [Pyricularia oryzae]
MQYLTNGGLDSRGMLLFKAALEAKLELQAPLPVTALIRARTLYELEKEIFRASVASSKSLLLPFSAHGSKTPLFLFPPGGGELHCWIELVRFLPDRPIYGLRLRGLQEGEASFETMQETVETFIREMKQVVPRGPYALLGMCFGGNVAFEVAKALEAGGGEVVFVGGVDNAPHLGAGQMSFDSMRFFIIDLLSTRGLLTAEEANKTKENLKEMDLSEFPQLIMRRFRTRLEAASVTLQRLEAWHRVFLGTARMASGYKPEGKISTYTSFWALPLTEWGITSEEWEARVGAWHGFAKKSSNHFVPGDHYTALSGAHINVFQALLNNQLQHCGL